MPGARGTGMRWAGRGGKYRSITSFLRIKNQGDGVCIPSLLQSAGEHAAGLASKVKTAAAQRYSQGGV
jgi:hypothetical protein